MQVLRLLSVSGGGHLSASVPISKRDVRREVESLISVLKHRGRVSFFVADRMVTSDGITVKRYKVLSSAAFSIARYSD